MPLQLIPPTVRCPSCASSLHLQFFDKDGDGVINFTDLVSGLSVLCKGTQGEKIVCKFGWLVCVRHSGSWGRLGM